VIQATIINGGSRPCTTSALIYTRLNFAVCFLATDETARTETYPLTKPGIARFIARLEPGGEVTANSYYFYG